MTFAQLLGKRNQGQKKEVVMRLSQQGEQKIKYIEILVDFNTWERLTEWNGLDRYKSWIWGYPDSVMIIIADVYYNVKQRGMPFMHIKKWWYSHKIGG